MPGNWHVLVLRGAERSNALGLPGGSRTVNGISAESPSCFWFRSAAEVSARDRGRPQTAATHQMRQRGPRLGRDHNDGEGAASGSEVPPVVSLDRGRDPCRSGDFRPFCCNRVYPLLFV